MPILNPLILESVLIESIKKDTEENLLKLMLSGKEMLEAVINYFNRTSFVEILEVGLVVQINGKPFVRISYNFPLFNIISKAILNSDIKELVVGKWPKTDIETVFLNKILQKDLKSVGLREKAPDEYAETIKNKATLEEIGLFYFVTYDDLLIVPSSCRILKIFFKSKQMMQKVPENLNLNQIKDIFVLDPIDHDLTPHKSNSFKTFVSTCFPNLKPLKMFVCTTQAVWYNAQKCFNALLFAAVSSKHNGSICFCSRSSDDYVSMAVKLFGFPVYSKASTTISVHGYSDT